MAITARAIGAWTATTTRNPTVTLPTHAAGDMLLVRIGWKSATPTTDVAVCNTSGWAKIGQFYDGGGASSNGGGGVLVAVFWKIAASAAETNPTIEFDDATAPTPGAYVAVSYQKASTEAWATPVGAGGSFASSTAISATIGSHITAQTGDLIDAFTVGNDNNTMTVPTFTQAGLTLDTVTEYPATALSSATSNDIEADGCYRKATAGTSSAAAVVTGTLNIADSGAAWTTRLRVVFDFSGTTAVSHTSSTSATGKKGASGTASVSHASATSAAGKKGGEGTASVTHASSTSTTGGGSGSLSVSHASATSAQGRKGSSGEVSVSHASATSATGEKGQTFDFSGSFTVTHASSTSVQGRKGGEGSASTAQASSVTAQGSTGRQGSVSVPITSATSAAGSRASSGVFSVSLVSSVQEAGSKGGRGSWSVDHASSTAATGSAAEAHAGTFSVSHVSGVSTAGSKAAASSPSLSLGSSVTTTGASDRSLALGISLVSLVALQGDHAGSGSVLLALTSAVAVSGVRGVVVDRPGISIGEGVSLGTTIADRGRYGGRATDQERTTVGVTDG